MFYMKNKQIIDSEESEKKMNYKCQAAVLYLGVFY